MRFLLWSAVGAVVMVIVWAIGSRRMEQARRASQWDDLVAVTGDIFDPIAPPDLSPGVPPPPPGFVIDRMGSG